MTVARALALALAALGAAGCRVVEPPAPGQVEHVVCVWLVEPADPQIEARLAATGRSFLGRIPGLLEVRVGDALPANGAPFHEDGFDLAFVMRFRSAAALAAYEEHPVHQAAVRDLLQPNAARLDIRDIVLR